MPNVNPDILVWARATAGLSIEEAAHKLALSKAERLAALEAGEREPSRQQLVRMAKIYRRPLLAFYLPQPPRDSGKVQDFRALPEGRMPGSEALLDALLRDVQARQGLVRAALEDTEEDEPLPFVASARVENGVDALVAAIRRTLAFSKDDFRRERTVGDAFSALRAAAEKAGVFVVLMGNLGTHHTDLDARVFRGFALADRVAPFIVINEKDSRAAWSFTLLHELAHIFLGQTGVSGYDGEAEIERFCDAVAARFLLDPDELAEVQAGDAEGPDDLAQRIAAFAAQRKVSRKMVAYNLLRARLVDAALYRSLSDRFDAERGAAKQRRAEGEGAPDYFVVRRHRLGPGLVGVVKRMVAGGVLTTTKAGRVLGVKPTAVHRLVTASQAA